MSKGIFVVMEQRYGKVQNVGLELVGEATRLKEDLKDDVVAVLLGHNIEGEVAKIFHYGADKVILVDHPMLENYVTEPCLHHSGRFLQLRLRCCDPAALLLRHLSDLLSVL